MTTPLITPQPGDFRVVPVGGEGGKLIAFGEWLNGDEFSKYQHAEVYVGNVSLGPPPRLLNLSVTPPPGYVMRAQPGGARLAQLDKVPGELWSSGVIDLTPEQRNAIVTAALTLSGVGYSWLDYGALALHHFGVNAPGLRAYISSTDHMICSQSVDWAYLQAGVHLFSDDRWPGYVTPAALAAVILEWKARSL